MKSDLFEQVLFAIAAVYDGVLGLVFLFAGRPVFAWRQVTPPNHWGYIQFPAAILIIFALMFTAVAVRPARNRNLIPYGCLLKLSYVAVVCSYWFTSGIPDMWKPFAIADAAFLVLFVAAYSRLGGSRTYSSAASSQPRTEFTR